jgi:hypothetical protein
MGSRSSHNRSAAILELVHYSTADVHAVETKVPQFCCSIFRLGTLKGNGFLGRRKPVFLPPKGEFCLYMATNDIADLQGTCFSVRHG